MKQEVWHGDCLELMSNIENNSIDMILCDLPYGVTNRQKWDIELPFDSLWGHYERITKENSAIVLFATEPFRTKLIFSNLKLFKYDLIWEKNKVTGFLNANKQPLRQHESILIFYKKQCTYNPQKTKGHKPVHNYEHKEGNRGLVYGETKKYGGGGSTERFPTSILKFNVVNNDDPNKKHSAQKPIDLLQYLIKTYSNEEDLILDNCAGSGSSLVAAKILNRQFIGIEKELEYYEICKENLNFDKKLQ